MPQQSIDRIKEAEDRASEIRAKALEEARAQVRAAEEENASWKEEQLKAIRHEARQMVEAAAEEAQGKAREADARFETERSAFYKKANMNMDKAVAIIVESIVGD